MKRIVIGVLATMLLLIGLVMTVLAIGGGRELSTVVFSIPAGDASAPLAPGNRTPDKSSAGSDSEWLTEYTLTERSGHRFHSRELAGKVHVVNFFFATCPTVCRMQTAAVQSLAEEFGPAGVKFLSITCDPDNDTPVALSLYAKQFHADPEQWLFLTGDLNYLRRVGGEVYFLPVDKQTHSEVLLVLDRRGKIRGRYSWKKPAEVVSMKAILRELLADDGQSALPPVPASAVTATPSEPDR